MSLETIDFIGQTADERPYEERQRQPGDYEAQVSQRPIAVHALEHRATSDRGVAWLRKAAEAGDARAMFNLGALMQDNAMEPGDLAKAREWLEKAYAGGYAKAAFNVGMFFDRGIGVEADPQLAAEWYRRGAEGGDPRAMNNLAVVLMEGRGVDASERAMRPC